MTKDIDKARWDRELPLTERAVKALEAAIKNLPKTGGIILGAHDYRTHLEAAATAALPQDVAKRFIGAHLRSARTTHLLALPGASLAGVQYLVGHKKATTTDLYNRPSFNWAADTLLRDTATNMRDTRPASKNKKTRKPV